MPTKQGKSPSQYYKNDLTINQKFPVSMELSQRIFSIPMHPYLDEKDIINITNKIINFLRK